MSGTLENNQESLVGQSVRQILEQAAKTKVQAVHFEPREKFVVVRFRVDNAMRLANKLPKHSYDDLARHLKSLSGLEAGRPQMPQDADFMMKIGPGNYNLRVSSMPVADGEKFIINITPQNNSESPSLEQLGLWGETLRSLDHALAAPHGLVLVASQQKSQTDSTLMAMMNVFGPMASKVFFSEDEKVPLADGVELVKLNREFGLGLGHYLELLGQKDFSVIAAEISDAASASAASKTAAKHDHLFLAGVPAHTSVGAFDFWRRALADHPKLITVRASLAQEFVPALCPHCRQAYQPSAAELDQLNIAFGINSPATLKQIHNLEKSAAFNLNQNLNLSTSETKIHNLWRSDVVGCEHCHHSGYLGSAGLFEVCNSSTRVQSLLAKKSTRRQLQTAALKDGMLSLPVDALIKTLRGIIDTKTLLEICRRYDSDFR
ncbi:MAG: ATPase, T2SS/T4P/T4SS family [Candidatus Saccharimonadales bacterium]